MNSSHQVTELLLKLNKLNHAIIAKSIQEMGITPQQLLVLRLILREQKTIGQISEALQLSYSTVSGIIDRLEREGWAERIRSDKDRRVVWIKVTDALTEKTKQILSNVFYPLFVNDTEEELERLADALQTIIQRLENVNKNNPYGEEGKPYDGNQPTTG